MIANFEIKMRSDSSSDPNIALDRLETAVESGHIGNLTVDSTYFVGWMKSKFHNNETGSAIIRDGKAELRVGEGGT